MRKKTRYTFICVISLFLIIPSVSSQIYIDENYGFFGGITISNFTGDETIGETDSRTGMNLGVYYRQPLNKRQNLFLMPELLFVSKGGKYETPQYGFAEFMLRYIEVPVLIGIENRHKISFHIGPYIGFLVHASDYHFRFGNISASDFQTVDLGGTAGIRARIQRVFLGFDIAGGLSQIGKTKLHEGVNYSLIGNARNMALLIYAGYFF